jgi:hypothetical protein
LQHVRNTLSPASALISANAPINTTTDNNEDIQIKKTNKDPDSLFTRRAYLAYAIFTTVTLQKAREKGVIIKQYPPECI